MMFVLPLLSFLLGYFAKAWLQPWQGLFATLLARLFIPILIIYNMVFYQVGSGWLIVFSLLCSIIFFALFMCFQADRLAALCFSYFNGAWLGFPLALSLFGTAASHSIVALYIGGSLFGNVCAVLALSLVRQNKLIVLRNLLLSPPVLALSIAGILSFWDWSAWQHNAVIELLYQSNKILVTFTGMCILGMWLSKVRVGWADLKYSMCLSVYRLPIIVLLCTLAYQILPIPQQRLTYAVMFMFFCLPPAANIVALESYYRGRGESAVWIAAGTLTSMVMIAIYALLLHGLDILSS